MASWNKTNIVLEDGTAVEAQEPYIISASRSTDIPAFYMDWFMHRLQIGYSAWKNPFNGTKNYISYKNLKFIVFWSKNPYLLLKQVDTLKKKDIGCYLQYTLNDYVKEDLETGVPSLSDRIDTFKKLSMHLGAEAVIWRFDPLLLTKDIDILQLLSKIEKIGDALAGYTTKMVFSFADISVYKKVKCNLEKNGVDYREWEVEQMEEFAERLSLMNKRKGWGYTLATCGEKISIEKYDIYHNRCIDGDLIVRLAWSDKVLMDYMNVKILDVPNADIFGNVILPNDAIILPEHHYFTSVHKKDKGQRLLCGCMSAKDIGEYNTCPHLCEYCYANANKEIAMRNWMLHKKNPFAETILG